MKFSKTRVLVESAIMIAIATLLSLIKLVDLPYGGSVTAASMLPIIIISYRHGLLPGFTAGLVYGVIQQLLGLKTLSYVTTWQSILAVILLDYVVAFCVIGIGGFLRRTKLKQGYALPIGAVTACVLRYACHVISGATVWAGLSIPTGDALIYSFAYNATYMIPETIVLAVSAFYLGSMLDFRAEQPVRLSAEGKTKITGYDIVAGLLLAGAAIFDVALVFAKLQNPETGDWDIGGLHSVNWMLVGVVSGVCAHDAAFLFLLSRLSRRIEERKHI